MAETCCENETLSSPCEPRAARRRRMEIRRVKFVAGVPAEVDSVQKRKKPVCYHSPSSFSRDLHKAIDKCYSGDVRKSYSDVKTEILLKVKEMTIPYVSLVLDVEYPKYGMASLCGRRRDMEDAIAIHPSFCGHGGKNNPNLHYFGVYDGHGCSHVAMKCRDRFHDLVKEELNNHNESTEFDNALERSFNRMDKEVIVWNEDQVSSASCRCELQSPECDAVGSTAVVSIVTPEKIIVANCGDSRAVLCRNGKAIPLSYDHKPDRPDELDRIQAAGGRVIFWEGARVLGVLAMSRAIGDNYLKPYVSCEPEITYTDRTVDDDCLILASDGLWDVVSNDTACAVARMCLRGKTVTIPSSPENEVAGGFADQACSDAAMLLTKLALARHSTDNVSVVVVDLKRTT